MKLTKEFVGAFCFWNLILVRMYLSVYMNFETVYCF